MIESAKQAEDGRFFLKDLGCNFLESFPLNELLDKIYKKYTKFTNRLLFFLSVQGIIDIPVADKWRIARSPCVALVFSSAFVRFFDEVE